MLPAPEGRKWGLPAGSLLRRRWFLLGLLLLVGLLFRIYKLNAYSLWLDEAWQYGSSDHPLERIRTNSFPPDQMFLSMLITQLHILCHFDKDVWQLRLSPVLFGVATIWATFLFVSEAFEERIAWVAALF